MTQTGGPPLAASEAATPRARLGAQQIDVRKPAWLMPRMLRAMPYLVYSVVGGTRP
jgi:hypothetical protein